MPSRPHPFTLLRALAVAILITISSGMVIPGKASAAAQPPYTLEERAAAIASPSLVYIEVRSRGFLRRKPTGEALNTQAIVVTSRCSGFLVGSEGHVVSSTHCVQQTADTVHRSAASQFGQSQVSDGKVASGQRDAYVRDVIATTEFTGETPGSKAERQLYAQLFRAKTALTTEPAIQGQVLEAMPIDDADIALLKLAQGGLPVGELTSQPVDTNAPLFLLAFRSESGAYVIQAKEIKIIGRYGNKDPVTYELDGDLGAASHGGMVVDSGGGVVGMINSDQDSKEKLNRLITNPEHIRKLLSNAGVTNTLAPSDLMYRNGLNDFYAGRYSEAMKKFDQILKVMPDHALAISYRKQAEDRFAIEGDQDDAALPLWLYATVIGLGVALLLCIVVIVWMVARRRSMQAAVPYGPFAPVSAMPMSGMPISGTPGSGAPVSGGSGTYYQPTYAFGPDQGGTVMPPPIPVDREDTPFTYPEPLPPRDGEGGAGSSPWAR